MSSTVITTTSAIIEWSPDGVIKEGEYSGFNKYGDYTIYWRSDKQFVYIGIIAKTTGWIAMALQPGLRMKDSDMIIGLVKDGKAEIFDSYSTDDFGRHPADVDLGGTNDILTFGGEEEGGFTSIEFKRLLVTSDKYDIPINKGPNKIIWSYGVSDDITLKHSTRGYGEIKP